VTSPASSGLLWLDPSTLLDHPTEAGPLGDLTDLTASVVAVGIVQPLLVEDAGDGRWQIVDGHHRAAVARLVGVRRVPCRPVREGSDATVVGLAVNGVRRAPGPVQQARAFGRLRDRGLRVAEVARRTGYAEGHVSDRLALLELDEETLERVEAGRISAARALAAIRAARRAAGRGQEPQQRRPDREPEPEYFGPLHRLAGAASGRCAGAHARRPAGRLGGVACGTCWEETIRADDRASMGLPHRGGTLRVGKPASASAGLSGAAPAAETRDPVPPAEKGGPVVSSPVGVVAAGPRPPAPAALVVVHDETSVLAVLGGLSAAGASPRSLSRADRLEVARRVFARGGSAGELAGLLGVTWDAADRLAQSAGAKT
jgi:ParB family chromosome partitioning protein